MQEQETDNTQHPSEAHAGGTGDTGQGSRPDTGPETGPETSYTAPPEAAPPKGKGWTNVLKEYVEAILTAIVLALLIRAFVVQAFKIPSGSMLETLQIGDHLLVNKFLYGTELPFTDIKVLGLREPGRGDIVVFKYPEDPRRDFIKRIIGAAGDTVEIINRRVYINGKPTSEPYAMHTVEIVLDKCDAEMESKWPMDLSCFTDNLPLIKVPEGKVFVMGDNRENSHDGRKWGFVDHKAIRGKAFIIYWSQDGSITNPRWDRIGDIIK